MATQRSSVTIVVVGDSSVGKTSLITTLVSGIFPETVPSVLQQVRIAPEDTADELGVLIVDTSSEETEREALFDKVVKNADVVICVYDATAPETFDRLSKVWLDKVSAVFQGPIVVVGNKLDLVSPAGESDSNPDKLRSKMKPLLERYRIDVALECSAKTNVHVTDLFYYAQHAVVFPVHPLLDTRTHTLQPAFKRALSRIFRFYDEDHDDFLSNAELNTFQEQCFGARLPNDDLDGIKSVLQKESTAYVEPKGITLGGFQFLFQLFIQRNRPETAWSVLRRFGYDDNLNLKSRSPVLLKALSREQSVELTKRGLAFFANVFHQFDRDNDGALSSAELDEVFSVCGDAGYNPWSESVLASNKDSCARSYASTLTGFPNGCMTNTDKMVTLSGWLAQWALTASLHPALVIEHLELLGFPDLTISSALKFTRKRSVENNDNRLQRTVVRAFCFGTGGVGKSTLLGALVKKSDIVKERQGGGGGAKSACGTVRPLDASHQPNNSGQASWFLVLTEVPFKEQMDFFTSASKVDCDLAILLFDPTDVNSVEHLRQLQTIIPSTIPCVYLANRKRDAGVAANTSTSSDKQATTEGATGLPGDTPLSLAAKLCKSYSLAEPDVVALEPPANDNAAMKWAQGMDKMFGLLMSTALFPGAARPVSDAQREIEKQKRLVRSIQRVSLVLGVLGGISYAAYYFLSSNRRDSATTTASKSDHASPTTTTVTVRREMH